jgi:uncharacterized protein (DUF1501 family)
MIRNRKIDPQRRIFLRRVLASAMLAATGGLSMSRVAFAAPCAGDSRFVFVILRGALDGLAAVPPVGDPDYARLRGTLAMAAPGQDQGALPLDGTFALHPSLTFLHECWQQKTLGIVHSVATPYRERSHFDAQDMLESGMARPHAASSGWLNRALGGLPDACRRGGTGIALGANIPLAMRGPVEVVRIGNAYITGDAAGLATRDMCEGIGPAIRSGLRAAESILGGAAYRLDDVTGASLGGGIATRLLDWSFTRGAGLKPRSTQASASAA